MEGLLAKGPATPSWLQAAIDITSKCSSRLREIHRHGRWTHLESWACSCPFGLVCQGTAYFCTTNIHCSRLRAPGVPDQGAGVVWFWGGPAPWSQTSRWAVMHPKGGGGISLIRTQISFLGAPLGPHHHPKAPSTNIGPFGG